MKATKGALIVIIAFGISGSGYLACSAKERAAHEIGGKHYSEAGGEKKPAKDSGGTIAKKRSQRMEIAVTDRGFQPDAITVKRGQPVEIVFTRKTDKACVKGVVLETSDEGKIQKPLPLNKPVTVENTFIKSRDYQYGCDLSMFSGTVIVQ